MFSGITEWDARMGNEKKTISIYKVTWNDFYSIVVKKYGNKKASIVLEEIIKDYVEKNGGRR